MTRLPAVTPRKLLRALARAGFFVHHSTGSHRVLKHPDIPTRRVIVPYHNKDLKRGTLAPNIRQTGLTLAEFLDLL